MISIDSKYLNRLILEELVSVISEQGPRDVRKRPGGRSYTPVDYRDTEKTTKKSGIDDTLYHGQTWSETFRQYIKNTDDGNKFREWVHDSGNYPKLQAEMNRRAWSDNTLSRNGNITSNHIKLAWRMFHDEYLTETNRLDPNIRNRSKFNPDDVRKYPNDPRKWRRIATTPYTGPEEIDYSSDDDWGMFEPINQWGKSVDKKMDQLGKDFKDTKFYMFLKQVQYDIESDINSITNPNSEKRRKMRHDFERLEEWALGYWSCWTGPGGWDCFINDPDLGIRGKLYSGVGIAATIFAELFPVTRVASRVLFALLLIDDIVRLNAGDTGFNVFFDLAIDSICLLSGGPGSLLSKGIKGTIKPISRFIDLMIQGTFKGFTGATAREMAEVLKYYRGVGMLGNSAIATAMREFRLLISKIDITPLLKTLNSGLTALKNSARTYLNSIINSPLVPDALKTAARGVKATIVNTINATITAVKIIVNLFKRTLQVIGGLISGAPLAKLLEWLGISTKYARAFGAASSAIAIGYSFEKYAEHQEKLAIDEEYRKIEEEKAQIAIEAGKISEYTWGYLKPMPDDPVNPYVPGYIVKKGQTGPELVKDEFGIIITDFLISKQGDTPWPIDIDKTKISILDTSADGKYKKIAIYTLDDETGYMWIPKECAELTGHWDR